MRGLRRQAWRFADWDFVTLQQSRLYDVLMRLPMLIWSAFLGLASVVVLQEYVRKADPGLPVVVYILNIAMRLSVIVYLVVIAATVVVRMRPARKARGVEPRISALIGTFLLTVVVAFPRRDLLAEIERVADHSVHPLGDELPRLGHYAEGLAQLRQHNNRKCVTAEGQHGRHEPREHR